MNASGDNSQTLLEVDAVTRTYVTRGSSVAAVRDVSLSLGFHDSIGVLGESGSGKSTLGRAIVGLEPINAGRILIEGAERKTSFRNRRERLAAAQQIQMVFQDPMTSLDPRETLSESLARSLSMHFGLKGAKRERRIDELSDMVGLTARQVRALPRDLSGGQRQRCAIARAFSVNPKVLVLDEAVSALDVSVQAQILNTLNDLRDELGVSYLFVSHDLAVIRYVTEHCLVMRNGTIVESGATESLLRDPQNDYTKLLIASIPSANWSPSESVRLRRSLESSET